MATTFRGQFRYYENINGKEKKVEKEFTDQKKFDAFTQKYPFPTLSDLFGLKTSTKKALPAKKSSSPRKKLTTTKKKSAPKW